MYQKLHDELQRNKYSVDAFVDECISNKENTTIWNVIEVSVDNWYS